MEFLISQSLKTKGFSRKTEALIKVGGGEMHSELSTPINCFFSSLGKICYYLEPYNGNELGRL